VALPSPRRLLSRRLVWIVVVALVLTSGTLTLSYETPRLQAGPVDSPANGTTIVATQGWNARGYTLSDRPARLVAVGPNGAPKWIYEGPEDSRNWFYDVDPLPNGNLLVVNPVPDTTVVYEFDPETGDRVWTERFDLADVHDVDLIGDDELLVAGINYDEGRRSQDRVFVYNRTRDAVTWTWHFEKHYPDDTGKGVRTEDWTHVNDVDRIRDGQFLVSVRNFDQVIVVNRSTKAIDLRLGRDGDHETLYEQHNPTYLESENGTPTILVADSENDRVVEYRRTGGPPGAGEWERVWTLSGELNWPRDADRLPNGNTLIVDSMNHRVIEVTPRGEVVWETSVPWATYDAERMAYGDEGERIYRNQDHAPTMHDLGAAGTYELHGGTETGVAGLPPIPAVVRGLLGETQLSGPITWVAKRWHHAAPWFTPTWMPTWSASLLVIVLVVLVWRAIEKRLFVREFVRRQLDRYCDDPSSNERG
jgi:outer membrane protein assembly factor BamB